MSYYTQIYLEDGGEIELAEGEGDDFEAAVEVLRRWLPHQHFIGPERWCRDFLSRIVMLCNHYELTVEAAMVRLSLRFPEAVFWVRGLGEDVDDTWLREYRNGQVRIRGLARRWRVVKVKRSKGSE